MRPEQAKAYRLVDNQTASLSEWDLPLLSDELGELKELDFDLTPFEFDESLFSPPEVEGNTDEDAIPEPPKVAVTKPGDLYLLGGKVKCPKCGKAHAL